MKHLTYAERIPYCQLAVAKKLLRLMEDKKTNLAISADVTSAAELISLAEKLGPSICILKTHIDIISDFTPELTRYLRRLADEHEFLIFEDRKFADIGNTVKHQYQGGIFRIVDWADIINAHSLPGPGIIAGLAAAGLSKGRGLLLLAEMSSAGHLFTKEYSQKTLLLAEKHPDFVFGFITQHAISTDPRWINMTPGIQLNGGIDTLGQQYVTPEMAINHHGADVIIVGRGIIHATNPQEMAVTYRAAGWHAYQNRLKNKQKDL